MENNDFNSNNLNLPVEKEEKKRKRKFIIWWFLFAFVLFIGLGILGRQLGWYWYPWEDRVIIGGNLKSGRPPGMTDEEWLSALQAEADDSGISFSINGRPSFSDSQSPGSLFISNPIDNNYDLEVKIFLQQTGELLYDSGLIPPDYYVDYDRLLLELPQGQYEATAYLKFLNGKTLVNAISVSLEITIKN